MYNPGCGGWDSNPRFPAYEAGDLAACLPRNGCTRRIRTSSLGYEPSELPLLHQCDIQGGNIFSVGAPTTAHERK